MHNFVASSVPADGLALSGARACAATVTCLIEGRDWRSTG